MISKESDVLQEQGRPLGGLAHKQYGWTHVTDFLFAFNMVSKCLECSASIDKISDEH